jgi:hypothetical protein
MTKKTQWEETISYITLEKMLFHSNVSSFTCEENGGHGIWYIQDFVCSKRGHNSPKFSLRVAKK